jgi:hypothetical protein
MSEFKQFTVISGTRQSPTIQTVILNGVLPSEQLTPKLACRAARIAIGTGYGATVLDEDAGIGYRLYERSARKLHLEV